MNWPNKLYAGVIGAMALNVVILLMIRCYTGQLDQPAVAAAEHATSGDLYRGRLPLFMPDSVIDDASLLGLLSAMATAISGGNPAGLCHSVYWLACPFAAAGGTPYAVAFSQLTTSLKLTQTYLRKRQKLPKRIMPGVMTKGSRGGWAVAC